MTRFIPKKKKTIRYFRAFEVFVDGQPGTNRRKTKMHTGDRRLDQFRSESSRLRQV